MSLDQVIAHYHALLEVAGWEHVNAQRIDAVAWSTWRVRDGAEAALEGRFYAIAQAWPLGTFELGVSVVEQVASVYSESSDNRR
jgi:hypothetical protein